MTIGQGKELTGMLVIAILVGVGYHVLVNRTRFGFDLRASGINPFAAQVGGVPAKRMIVIAMVLSGAVAGLVGMTETQSSWVVPVEPDSRTSVSPESQRLCSVATILPASFSPR